MAISQPEIWVITVSTIMADSHGSVKPHFTRKFVAGPPVPLGCAAYGEVRAESVADAYLALTQKETGIAVFC